MINYTIGKKCIEWNKNIGRYTVYDIGIEYYITIYQWNNALNYLCVTRAKYKKVTTHGMLYSSHTPSPVLTSMDSSLQGHNNIVNFLTRYLPPLSTCTWSLDTSDIFADFNNVIHKIIFRIINGILKYLGQL